MERACICILILPRTSWWNGQRGAASGQKSCDKEKWLIIRNCCIMHSEMPSGWLGKNSHSSKPIWLPVRRCGPYRIWIKRISRAEKQFHTDFTPNCQRVAPSQEFWSHWRTMERFNARWMVNRKTEGFGAKINHNQRLCVFDKCQNNSFALCWVPLISFTPWDFLSKSMITNMWTLQDINI